MQLRPLFRPLPLLIVTSFVLVAVVDLVQTLREEPLPPPVLLQPGAVRFEPLEPMIDLRSGHIDAAVRLLPEPVLMGALWSEPDAQGTWVLGDGAELEVDLAHGGHRTINIEARPAAGKRPVRSVGVSINGVVCGAADLHQGWQWITVGLAEGVVRSGVNVISFRIPDRTAAPRARRALELRRIGLGHEESGEPKASTPTPLTIDFESQAVVIFSPGVLEADFTIDDRVDALRMNYRFDSRGGGGEVTISRPEGGGIGRDAPARFVIRPSGNGVERLRVPLHGRRGEFLFRLRVEGWTGPNRLDVRSLELVTERHQTKKKGDQGP